MNVLSTDAFEEGRFQTGFEGEKTWSITLRFGEEIKVTGRMYEN